MLNRQNMMRQGSFLNDQDILEELRVLYQGEHRKLASVLKAELLQLLQLSRFSEPESREMKELLTENIQHLSALETATPLERTAWKTVPVSRAAQAVPGMLDEDTMRYYSWLARNYTGEGEVVELGSWLGGSTVCLAESLSKNPRFTGRSLHVFDSFRWERWMLPYLEPEPELYEAFKIGESFLDLFRQYCGAFEHLVTPHKQLLNTDGERTRIPPLTWTNKAVELLFYDFGQEYAAIKSAFALFSPWFIPGKTILVIQPYGNPQAEMLRRFCRDHADYLKAVHKPYSSAKGFLFTGSARQTKRTATH